MPGLISTVAAVAAIDMSSSSRAADSAIATLIISLPVQTAVGLALVLIAVSLFPAPVAISLSPVPAAIALSPVPAAEPSPTLDAALPSPALSITELSPALAATALFLALDSSIALIPKLALSLTVLTPPSFCDPLLPYAFRPPPGPSVVNPLSAITAKPPSSSLHHLFDSNRQGSSPFSEGFGSWPDIAYCPSVSACCKESLCFRFSPPTPPSPF